MPTARADLPSGFLSLFSVLYASEDSTHSSPVWDHFRSTPTEDQRLCQTGWVLGEHGTPSLV